MECCEGLCKKALPTFRKIPYESFLDSELSLVVNPGRPTKAALVPCLLQEIHIDYAHIKPTP